MKARLARVSARIQRLAEEGPAAKRAWERVADPVLRRLFRRPRITSEAVARLVRNVSLGAGLAAPSTLARDLRDATKELERGVRAVERAAWVTGRVPTAEVSWLWRLYQIVYRARQLVEEPADAAARRALAAAVEQHELRPLAAPGAEAASMTGRAVDPLVDAARHEFRRLGRKRRLLEAARQLLLEAAAAGGVDAEAARARRRAIAQQIARLDRLQGAGLSPDVDLVYQARQAQAHGDLQRLAAALAAIEECAVAAGQAPLGELAGSALERLWGRSDRRSEGAKAASLARSQQEIFGAQTRERIEAAYRRARANLPDLRAQWKQEGLGLELFKFVERYLEAEDATAATLAAAVAADGCFDLGGAVSPVRSLEINQRLVQVRHPTQDMTLVPAQGVSDLPDAVIEDPRTMVQALAAGTLLTRRYLALEEEVTERKGLRNDARVYVLDGSGSMLGPRARMRDALLITELVTLAARLEDAERAGNPVLYYCYFNEAVTPVRRVATAAEADAAIAEVIATVRTGGTDIQKALVLSFDQLRRAREGDPDLVHAQLVLVTDGEAAVDEGVVQKARAAVGELPIGVSIIALGQENPALRELAAHQRARGERVFYQFMDDGELSDVVGGRTAGLPIHLPAEKGRAALSADLEALMAEIEQRSRQLEVADIHRAGLLETALAEVGLSLEEGLTETGRARHEALLQDQATLAQRFARWFPLAGVEEPPIPVDAEDGEALEEIRRLLATVAEVVAFGGTSPLERQADAIEIMERLLRESMMAPWRYADLVRRHPGRLAEGMRALNAVVGGASLSARRASP